MPELEYRLQNIDYRIEYFIIACITCVQSAHKWLYRARTTRGLMHTTTQLKVLLVQKLGFSTLNDPACLPLTKPVYSQGFGRFNRSLAVLIPTIHSAYKNKNKFNLRNYIIERATR